MMGRVLIVRAANLPTDREIGRTVAAASTVRAGHRCFPGSRIQEMKRPGTHTHTHTHTLMRARWPASHSREIETLGA